MQYGFSTIQDGGVMVERYVDEIVELCKNHGGCVFVEVDDWIDIRCDNDQAFSSLIFNVLLPFCTLPHDIDIDIAIQSAEELGLDIIVLEAFYQEILAHLN